MDKIIFVNGQTPALNSSNLNQLQTNIENVINDVENLAINNGMPIGSGCDYYGTTAPENYMFADGSAISRTTYAELFSIIGTTYGSGDGSTTFNLPDKRERVSVMYKENSTNGTTGATLGNMGAKGGEFKHEQTENELAQHNHAVYYEATFPFVSNGDAATATTAANRTANFSTSGGSGTGKLIAMNKGGGQGMNVMQPYLVCNYIIKVK